MREDVDAVIAALRIVLKDAEKRSTVTWWKTRTLNRWINQLPGAWLGRWRQLKLGGDIAGEVLRQDFVGHTKATIAYLEANRTSIQRGYGWLWPIVKRKQPSVEQPIDAQFEEVKDLQPVRSDSDQSIRLIKH